GGKSLEGRCIGPPPVRSRTIVLLHEGLGSMRLWRDLPDRLAAATGHGVFVYSRAGHGHSDPVALPRPLDYMTHEALDVLPAVLDAIGLRQGVLLGHSDGASIITVYAGSVQDHRVRGLVLMAPHLFTEPEGLRSIADARTAYETGDLRERLARHHQNVDITFRGWNDAWLDQSFRAWNIEDCIDYIRVPVLAIQGKEDQYGTEAQIGALAERLYAPLETAMLDDCGHSPFIEQPSLTLNAVCAFIARLDRIESVELGRHEA
ncbi:MAG: alpha/beta fold hydrolase, partial [Geminicoccales bacterium]